MQEWFAIGAVGCAGCGPAAAGADGSADGDYRACHELGCWSRARVKVLCLWSTVRVRGSDAALEHHVTKPPGQQWLDHVRPIYWFAHVLTRIRSAQPISPVKARQLQAACSFTCEPVEIVQQSIHHSAIREAWIDEARVAHQRQRPHGDDGLPT